MSPYKALFGTEAFEAWGEVDMACIDEEPEGLAQRLAMLHQHLQESREEAVRQKSQPYSV